MTSGPLHDATVLSGWKAIATHLRRDERTAMRWARQRGMPVHRVPGGKHGPVYAKAGEIAQWMARSLEATEPQKISPAEEASHPGLPAATMALSAGKRATPIRSRRLGWSTAALVIVLAGAAVAGDFRLPTRSDGKPAHMSNNSEAEAQYLQGRYDLSMRTAVSLRDAEREFTRALALDPEFAEAHSGLSEVYLMQREYGGLSDAEAYARAKPFAERALALRPDLAAAHRDLAFIAFWSDNDPARAKREFKRAIELAPDDAETHHWYATALTASGDQRGALMEIALAQRLAPESTPILADAGLIRYVAGDRTGGIEGIRKAIARQPDQASPHQYLAALALARGDGAEFLTEARIAANLRGDKQRLGVLDRAAQGFASSGQAGLLAALEAQEKQVIAKGGSAFRMSQLAALRGDPRTTLQYLTAAQQRRDPQVATIRGDLNFDRMRDQTALKPFFDRPQLTR